MPSEFSLIERYFTRPARHSTLGVGDDAAIVRPAAGMELLISTDMLVSGTHFLPDTGPAALGWKTLAVNVSDMAAMGARPRWAVLAAALPGDCARDEGWIAAFAQGFFDCADAFGVDVIGGDTTRGPLNFCVTIFGEVEQGRALLRSGARSGDDVWVSGTPGCAALGLAHLQGRCVLPEEALAYCLDALHKPQPRVALGNALSAGGLATAAIDVSDGLLADLGHLLERSGVSARLDFCRLPTRALSCGAPAALAKDCLLAGGDDYELVFTSPPGYHDRIAVLGETLGLPLHCIGRIEEPANAASGPTERLILLDADGQPMQPVRRGYDHFSAGASA